jgi:hypothetical protein
VIASELLDLFRSDVDDQATPYLWSDTEVYLYMDDAYKSFVRKTGGISDETSALTLIPIVAGESYSEVSSKILKFRLATLVSTQDPVLIVNAEDVVNLAKYDYGVLRPLNQNTPGRVTHMVVGVERTAAVGKVKWVQKPIVSDSVQLTVMRMPLDDVTEANPSFAFDEILSEHHQHLLAWMKHRAYGKQDAESFDRGKREEYKIEFLAYCTEATAENERYKSKPVRVVKYGGI